MSGRWGGRKILIAVGLVIAFALGGVGTASGSRRAIVTRHYGPLEMVDGQTARLNATNLYAQSQKFTLALYDGLGSVLKASSLTLTAGASGYIEYQSVGKSTIVRGLTKSSNPSMDGSLELYDPLANNENVMMLVAPLLSVAGTASPVGISKSDTAVMYVTNLGSQVGVFTLSFFDITGNAILASEIQLAPGQSEKFEYTDPSIDGRALVRGSIGLSGGGRFVGSFGVRDGSGRYVMDPIGRPAI